MKSDTSIWLLRSVSWRRWKRGLCVAVLTGALTGVVAVSLGVEMTLKQAVALLALSIAKDCLLFLKQYPVQHTTDTTHFIYKHLRLFGWLALAALAAGCISRGYRYCFTYGGAQMCIDRPHHHFTNDHPRMPKKNARR